MYISQNYFSVNFWCQLSGFSCRLSGRRIVFNIILQGKNVKPDFSLTTGNLQPTTKFPIFARAMDQYAQRMYEMKLEEIYRGSSWIPDEISLLDFIALFPVEFKNGKAIRPDKPKDFDLDRDTYLAIMVAFRQAFS